ncbi:MAG: hypothetical protein LRY71_06105 [Bacillaceae bacterium]|nr:hypothetical protein [Bacillaceae bacterium]
MERFFIDIFMIERLQLHFLRTFHLSQYTLSTLLANEVWGIHLFWQQIWLSRIFVIGFAVMLMTIMIMLLNNRRATSLQRKWNWYGVSGVLLAILLLVPYTIDYLETARAFAVIHEDAYLVGEEYFAARDSFYDFVVEAYEIEVERKEDDSLVIEANLFIDQEQLEGLREISFRINPLFEVNHVSLNERIVPFSQDGSLVTLEELALIDGLQRVQFSYEGKMNLVGLRAFDYSGVSLFSFVDGDALFLDSDIGWYPIPGNIPLFTDFGNRQVHLRGQERTPQLASFHLTLTNFNDVYGTIATINRQKGSQVLFSKATSGVSLFGGNFVEISANDRMVVTNSFNKSEAARLLTDMEMVAEYFGEILENVTPLRGDLLVIPNDGLGFYQYGVAMKDNSIVIPMSYLNRFVNKESVHDYTFIREITYYHLFQEFSFKGSFYGDSLAPALEHSFYFLYLKDGLQLDEEEFERAANHAPYHFYMGEVVNEFELYQDWGWTREEYEEHYEMERTSHRAGRMVLDALKEGKIDEVKQFLVEMYETYVIPQQGQQYVYQPEITVENWDEMWNKVMRNE